MKWISLGLASVLALSFMRYTNAWMRQGGRWGLAFRHANNVRTASGK